MWINGKWSLIWINSEPIIDVERSDHIQICLVSILFKIVVNNLKTREIFIVFVLNVSSKHKNVAIEEIKGLKLNLCQVWINLENWLAQKYVGPYPAHQFKTNFPQNPAQFIFLISTVRKLNIYSHSKISFNSQQVVIHFEPVIPGSTYSCLYSVHSLCRQTIHPCHLS